jgi:ribosomal protein S18 acetylase RimI-like enzyme
MDVAIRNIRPAELGRYAQVPCAFQVNSTLVVEPIDGGLGGLRMREEPVVPPYVKDYDAHGEGTPQDWPREFDVRHWGFFLAVADERPVAGAAVAWRTPAVHMLANRDDMAVLWDIRVHPAFRHQGLGERILKHAADWSREQGARLLKIETQNINVRACRFYHKQGCRLGEIDCYGYAGVPRVAHEVMLIWYLDL